MTDFPVFLRRYFQSLAGCAYLFAGGVLRQRHRALLYTLCKHFGFEKESEDHNATPAPTVPKIPAADVIRDETDVRLSRIADVAWIEVDPDSSTERIAGLVQKTWNAHGTAALRI